MKKPIRTFDLTSPKLIRAIIILGILLLLASLYGWWTYIRNNPERLFWRAVDNALQTRGVTRQIVSSGEGQPDQFLRLHTTPAAGTVGLNKYYQGQDTSVPTLVTETLGTETADYIRVAAMNSTDPSQPTPDISSIRNIWANATPQGLGDSSGQLYNQFILGVVPFGNLNIRQRRELIRYMQEQDIYQIDFASVNRGTDQGRPVYIYEVSIDTQKYLVALKKFCEYVGSDQLKDVDPAQYAGSQPLRFQLTIDVLSRQLIIAQQAQGEVSRYHSYGLITPPLKAPDNPVPLEELQQKLQNLQQQPTQ